MKYTVIFEHGARNVSAYVPDLPGCVAAGKSVEDTRELIRAAIAAHIASLRETGQDVPAQVSYLEQLEVAV